MHFEAVLEKVKHLADDQKDSAKNLACAKLRMAKLNHEDPEFQEKIDQLILHLS